jgi:hypothetical protein
MMFSSDKDGYVSSDRPGSLGFDDIYRFIRNSTSLEGMGELGIDRGDFLRTEDGRFITSDVAESIGIGLESIPKKLESRMIDVVMNEDAELRIFFNYNDQSLNQEALKALDKFMEEYGVLNADIGIIGYADETGQADRNLILSQKRAEAAKSYLVSKGYNAEQIYVVGKGQLKLPKSEQVQSTDRNTRLAPARKADITFTFKDDK